MTFVSKTYNTSIKANKGDLLTVSFVDASKYIDPETKEIWFNLWAPHVVGKAEGKTTSIKELESIVSKTTGRVQEKKMRVFEYTPEGTEPKESKSKSKINKRPDARTSIPEGYPANPEEYADYVNMYYPLSTSYFAGKAIQYWRKPENKAKYTKEAQEEIELRIIEALRKFNLTDEIKNAKARKYVFQLQFPQAFAHMDFRYENDVGSLNGMTMAVSIPEKRKSSPLVHDTKKKTVFWKDEIYYSYDNDRKIIIDNTKKLENEILDYYKAFAKDNTLWKIDLRNGEEKKRRGEKAEVEKIWSTDKEPEPLAWLKVSNTVIPPKIINPDMPGGTEFLPGIFIEVDSGVLFAGTLKTDFQEFFLDGTWKGRIVFRKLRLGEKFSWLYWKPDDQDPYVLSRRAVSKQWLPDGYSALPPQKEHVVPPKLVYWDTKITKQERLKRRETLIDFFENREMINSDGEFILSQRSYRGQFVIRGLFIKDYFLKLGGNYFYLDENPFEKSASAEKIKSHKDMFKNVTIKPGHPLYPTDLKEIDVYLQVLRRGRFKIDGDELALDGLKFKFIQSGKTNFYSLTKT